MAVAVAVTVTVTADVQSIWTCRIDFFLALCLFFLTEDDDYAGRVSVSLVSGLSVCRPVPLNTDRAGA